MAQFAGTPNLCIKRTFPSLWFLYTIRALRTRQDPTPSAQTLAVYSLCQGGVRHIRQRDLPYDMHSQTITKQFFFSLPRQGHLSSLPQCSPPYPSQSRKAGARRKINKLVSIEHVLLIFNRSLPFETSPVFGDDKTIEGRNRYPPRYIRRCPPLILGVRLMKAWLFAHGDLCFDDGETSTQN
ncbi:hypothetical protein PM082_015339 [Marasmius tenuissimus]|nr:hypothetical protein PM082_015339 [Marasmius tenuissimus]